MRYGRYGRVQSVGGAMGYRVWELRWDTEYGRWGRIQIIGRCGKIGTEYGMWGRIERWEVW